MHILYTSSQQDSCHDFHRNQNPHFLLYLVQSANRCSSSVTLKQFLNTKVMMHTTYPTFYRSFWITPESSNFIKQLFRCLAYLYPHPLACLFHFLCYIGSVRYDAVVGYLCPCHKTKSRSTGNNFLIIN